MPQRVIRGQDAQRAFLAGQQTERQFQQQVVALARACGWLVFHTWNSLHSPAGEPDLRLVRERVVWAELKREGRDPNPIQEAAIAALRAAGAEVYVWRPSDLEEIVRVLA